MLNLLAELWYRVTRLFGGDMEYNRIEPMIGLTLVHDVLNVNVSNILVPANSSVEQLYRWVSDSLNINKADVRLYHRQLLLNSSDATAISNLGIEDGIRLSCILRNRRSYHSMKFSS